MRKQALARGVGVRFRCASRRGVTRRGILCVRAVDPGGSRQGARPPRSQPLVIKMTGAVEPAFSPSPGGDAADQKSE